MQYWKYLKDTLTRWYDWWIYRHAYSSLRRLSYTDPGFTYLLQLQLGDLHQHMPETLKKSAEIFHAEINHAKYTATVAKFSDF